MNRRDSGGGFSARETQRAKRAFWILLAVAVVSVAQVSWWIIYQVGQAGRIAELQKSALELRGFEVTVSLSGEYAALWEEVHLLVSDSNWTGAVPRWLTGHPLLSGVSRLPSVGRILQSPFGQYEVGSWTWFCPGVRDTLWIAVDRDKLYRKLESLDPRFEFAARPPAPGPQPWPFDPLPVRPRAELQAEIDGDRHRTVIMFASEGAFFLLLTVVGVYLIYRTVRKSADLGRRQHNFVSAVTHEMKAPLASLKLYAETLQRPEIVAAQQKEFLERMLQDVSRLEHTIDNTLMAGRLEEKGFHLELKTADFSQAVMEYEHGLKSYLERHRFTLTSRIEPGIRAVFDYDAMRRVVESLIDNAVKYSGDSARGELAMRRTGDRLVLTVTDFGTGIPADQIDKVFGAFYRVGDEMTRQIKGTGLGLYLVREIVAAHGGEVSIHSAGAGKGTTAKVELRTVA